MRKMVVLPGLMLLMLFAVGVACAGATPTPTPRPTATPTAVTAQATPTPTPTSTPIPKGFLGPGPKVQLSFLSADLPPNPSWTEVDAYFAEKVIPERSNGRVSVRINHYAEVGLTLFDFVPTIQSGAFDIATTPMPHSGGYIPLGEAVDLPGLYPDHDTARAGALAFTPEYANAARKFNLQKLGFILPSSGSQLIFCKPAVSGLSDLKGKKVRVFGTVPADFFATLGATPVSLSFSEVYAALERGVVDCAITGALSANSGKWYEVTSYIIPVAAGGMAQKTYFINATTWNTLPKDVQEFLEVTFTEMAEKMWTVLKRADADGIACSSGDAANCKTGSLAPARNVSKVVQVTEADRAVTRDILAKQILPKWLTRCGPDCAAVFNRTIGRLVGVEVK